MKLGTLDEEPRQRPDAKKASDAADIYRLLDHLNTTGVMGDEVSRAPGDIAELTADNLQRHFVERAEITARRIRTYIPAAEPIEPNDLRRVATRFSH